MFYFLTPSVKLSRIIVPYHSVVVNRPILQLIFKIANVCCLCLACSQSWWLRRHSLPWRVSRTSLSRNTWVACWYLCSYMQSSDSLRLHSAVLRLLDLWQWNSGVCVVILTVLCIVLVQKLPVTKIVDALMESKSMAEVDDYRYFDPKLLRPADR